MKVIVQGITGSEGWKHTVRMLQAGTDIVGGVNPKKAGMQLEAPDLKILPVYANCSEAKAQTDAQASVIFVPPAFAKDAVIEAVDAGFDLVVVITEGIPIQDSVEFIQYASQRDVQIIGPNCPGILEYDYDKSGNKFVNNIGIIPDGLTKSGRLALVSKSGTLTYQMIEELGDIGFKKVYGIGGDPCIGTTHIDALKEFEKDENIDAIVLIGEIGGSAEEEAAQYISQNVTKKVFGYIAGVYAPEGKTMGHAGAIISSGKGTAASKTQALKDAGVFVGLTPQETANAVRDYVLRSQSL